MLQMLPSESFFHKRRREKAILPCVFFSRALTAPKWNYGIFNKKFLTIKYTFQNWRHFLEEVHFPIEVNIGIKTYTLIIDQTAFTQTNQMEPVLFVLWFNTSQVQRTWCQIFSCKTRILASWIRSSTRNNSTAITFPASTTTDRLGATPPHQNLITRIKAKHSGPRLTAPNGWPQGNPSKYCNFIWNEGNLLKTQGQNSSFPCREEVLHFCYDNQTAWHGGVFKTA